MGLSISLEVDGICEIQSLQVPGWHRSDKLQLPSGTILQCHSSLRASAPNGHDKYPESDAGPQLTQSRISIPSEVPRNEVFVFGL